VSEKRNFEYQKFSVKVKVKNNNDAVEKLVKINRESVKMSIRL
ncbi:12414_t:CDS:1, partial [Racocetra persica]